MCKVVVSRGLWVLGCEDLFDDGPIAARKAQFPSGVVARPTLRVLCVKFGIQDPTKRRLAVFRPRFHGFLHESLEILGIVLFFLGVHLALAGRLDRKFFGKLVEFTRREGHQMTPVGFVAPNLLVDVDDVASGHIPPIGLHRSDLHAAPMVDVLNHGETGAVGVFGLDVIDELLLRLAE